MTAEQITAITTAVDYTSVIAGFGGVAAVIGGVYVAFRGAKMILSFVRS